MAYLLEAIHCYLNPPYIMSSNFKFTPLVILLLITAQLCGQDNSNYVYSSKDKFRFVEAKFQFGSFLKSSTKLNENGLLDNGYGGVTLKLGWQPNDPDSWASSYSYPSYGVGLYSGFLSDAEVFGNPNAIFGFIKFPISSPENRNIFSIEPSFGLTYNLEPYDSETNPLNEAIGARAAVYFNIDLGFTYKWTREVDLLYGFNFSHFSNGATYKPNNGLNLYGLNVALQYNYNRRQLKTKGDLYNNDEFAARFKRPKRSPTLITGTQAISIYTAGGIAQSDDLIGSNVVLGTFSGVVDYEYEFNEKSAITGGVDIFYDNRLQDLDAADRWMYGVHAGYDFRFYRFAVKMQVGTYLGDDNEKGAFFLRPALRYDITDHFFAQLGLKTLDGGSADYIEYGIGFRPFNW